jgi:hypothetical protein
MWYAKEGLKHGAIGDLFSYPCLHLWAGACERGSLAWAKSSPVEPSAWAGDSLLGQRAPLTIRILLLLSLLPSFWAGNNMESGTKTWYVNSPITAALKEEIVHWVLRTKKWHENSHCVQVIMPVQPIETGKKKIEMSSVFKSWKVIISFSTKAQNCHEFP